jgi:Tol biopolymer transport system component
MTRERFLGLSVIVLLLVGLAASVASIVERLREPAGAEVSGRTRLVWVATAHQYGPVSYRDPAGAISPDGRWIAYSEGRFLRVRPIGGGPSVEFPPGDAQIRYLAWSPDSRRIVADGRAAPVDWAVYDRVAATREPLWPDRANTSSLRQLVWSPDGASLVGVANGREGSELWTVQTDGVTGSPARMSQRIASPAWTTRRQVACITTMDGRARVTLPCGKTALASQPDADAYGPLAVSPDADIVYASLANAGGTVDLWALPTGVGQARRLTAFDRDSYAPSVAADGSIVFKVQSYRTVVAVAPASGGPSQPLATFTSETPSWDPTGKWIGLTYGTWRRVPDDAKYPDIAQDAGIIAVDPAQPAAKPSSVVHDSASEDQSLCWSPNGQWIAFHSHKELSDDLWLRRASGDATAKRITMLGRGAEAGWPRWSRDGRWLLFTGASRGRSAEASRSETPSRSEARTPGRKTVMYVVGMNQDSGETTSEAREIAIADLGADVFHAEWLDAGDRIVAVGKEDPGRHFIFTVGRDGGRARVIHRFASEHDVPGVGVSPDGKAVAFIAPAPDGFFQVFRLPIDGGQPVQVTTDPSNKTQPAWSPDGQRIAFTVWNYDAQFWRLEPR